MDRRLRAILPPILPVIRAGIPKDIRAEQPTPAASPA